MLVDNAKFPGTLHVRLNALARSRQNTRDDRIEIFPLI